MRLTCLLVLLIGIVITPIEADADDVQLVPESVRPCGVPCSRIAVVFFHGFTGARSTWLNETTNFYWPTELATDPEIGEQLDVYRIDYRSSLRSGPPFDEIGRAIGGALDPLMIQKQYSKVVLIGHSMGGIVAEAYMLHVKSRFGHKGLARFPFQITLATPFLGSSLEVYGSWVASNPQIRILAPIEKNDFEQFLNRMWQDVGLKHEACLVPRTILSDGLVRYAAYEGVPTIPVGIVVDELSATQGAREKIKINRTHTDLPKPPARSDLLYKWVKEALVACASLGGSLCAPPAETCPSGDFPLPSP